jgi:DnaJ family protein A protein 2
LSLDIRSHVSCRAHEKCSTDSSLAFLPSFQVQVPCNDCDGTGEIIDQKHKCKVCNAKKVISERKVLEVHIDKGMKGGQQITFAGESDQAPGTIPGDVVIVVEEKPHPTFKRQGDNLFAEINVDLLTALGGGEFSILHLDERAVHVTIKPGEVIKDGTSSFLF